MVLYTDGTGLEAEYDRERQSTQQGRAGSFLGPVTLGWWVCVGGSLIQGSLA